MASTRKTKRFFNGGFNGSGVTYNTRPTPEQQSSERSKLIYETDPLVLQNERERQEDWDAAKGKMGKIIGAGLALTPAGRAIKATRFGKDLLDEAQKRIISASKNGVQRSLAQRNPKVITSKKNLEEFSGINTKPEFKNSPAERNKMYRKEAEQAGIPYKEYLKGRTKARSEGVAPGLYWGDLFKKGGKVKKYAGKDDSMVKKDKPYLGPREQADVTKMEQMQKKSKTPIGDIEPVPGQYDKKEEKKFAKGGKIGESKAMVKKEMSFMKRKGAPKSMIAHEKEEAKGMKRGGGIERRGSGAGKVIKMKKGGMVDGVAQRGKTKGKVC